MELEQVRTKREQLKNEINKKTEEVDTLKKEKASLEADVTAKSDKINTAEQSIIEKRDELKKLETAIEIMER